MEDHADTADANTFENLLQHDAPAQYPETDHNSGDLSSEQPPSHSAPLVIQTEPGQTSLNVVVKQFPYGHPGASVTSIPQGSSVYESAQDRLGELLWAPFRSECDWEIARWAKMRGPTSTATTELLAIPGVCVQFTLHCVTKAQCKVVDRLGLSYSTSRELNKIIDMKLTPLPLFQCQPLTVGGECLEFHYRNIIECIQALFGNPEFVHDLVFAPERHYTDATQACRVYNEMHTGDWWWSVQVCIWPYSEIILTCDTRCPWRRIVLVQL
jgi:hypothetical protein